MEDDEHHIIRNYRINDKSRCGVLDMLRHILRA
jgi:hypothetical protein